MVVYSLSNNLGSTISAVGTILAYAGNVDKLPSVYLVCNGTSYPTAAYPELAAILGQSHLTTFNVPDMRNRMLVGKGVSFPTLLATGGANSKSLDIENIPIHNHDVTVTQVGLTHGATNQDGGHTHNGVTKSDGAHSHSCTNNDTSYKSFQFVTDAGKGYNLATGNNAPSTINWVENVGTGVNVQQESEHGHTGNADGVTWAHAHNITAPAHTHTVNIAEVGTATSFDIIPPCYIINYIIRAKRQR